MDAGAGMGILEEKPPLPAAFEIWPVQPYSSPVFLNRRAAARYRALASIIPGRERPEDNIIRYKI